MALNLDLIDELRKRTNVSYGDAKEALEKCNGDLLEALVYLEKQNKVKPEQNYSLFKNLFHKANSTRFIIHKKNRTVFDMSVTVSIIITVFASYIVIPLLLIGLVTGYRMKFEGLDGEGMKVNEALNKVSDAVDSAKRKLADEGENTATS
ncbi:DUF4342 domain-containing protein [Desulforamulus aquiferis]|uniref:DUF4342 domain-containing protein n=1 Tax=Desulforamulus aquiferis TaxID=1397668 RepID=A0AAW7Z8U7_9FIRM|nr:DUF4342 domain-containing protein [Desulforamulus aquiferis]MDO7785709.1 DUF4342 domain-containing protein [Desulforamulus aquiferis]